MGLAHDARAQQGLGKRTPLLAAATIGGHLRAGCKSLHHQAQPQRHSRRTHRKPTANGLGVMATSWRSRVRYSSRALWPTASTTWEVAMVEPSAHGGEEAASVQQQLRALGRHGGSWVQRSWANNTCLVLLPAATCRCPSARCCCQPARCGCPLVAAYLPVARPPRARPSPECRQLACQTAPRSPERSSTPCSIGCSGGQPNGCAGRSLRACSRTANQCGHCMPKPASCERNSQQAHQARA